MDITPQIPALTHGRHQLQSLMAGTTTVACFGNRALLSLFVCAAPDPDSLLGAVTTEEEGVELAMIRRAHSALPCLRTLLILQDGSTQKIRRAVELGCNGVVVESRLAQGTMVHAIRAVIGGGIYADVLGVNALRATSRGDGPEPLEDLSEREREVLQLVTRGYTNKDMAEALIVSSETIKTHITNILGKLQAKDRTHAAVIGVWRGLVSGE
jgi:DNA-binding NarL/FixJ family response regulator